MVDIASGVMESAIVLVIFLPIVPDLLLEKNKKTDSTSSNLQWRMRKSSSLLGERQTEFCDGEKPSGRERERR